MADFDNTALNSNIRELWDEKVEEARYATAVIMNRVANRSAIAKKKGDIIHVTIDGTYTVGTVSSAGVFAPQNYAPTTVDITLNQWEQIAIQVLDRAQAQSFWTPDSIFPRKVGEAFGARYDAQLAALYSDVAAGNDIGSTTNPSAFDKTKAQEAMLRLAALNVPLEDLSWVIHPAAYYTGITNEEQLTSAHSAGLAKNVLTTGFKFPLFGVPVYTSMNIIEIGSPAVHKNLLIHKSALGIAWQKEAEIEHVRSTANLTLADMFVAQSLYGLKTIRSNHFIVANSSAS